MGNQLALIDVLDENGVPTGQSKNKTEIHEQGLWHNAAHIWMYNSNGDILLQLRSKDKDSYPGLWDISVAGHTDSGESPIESAIREMKEEIGLSVEPKQLVFDSIYKISQPIKGTNWFDNERGNVYFYKFDNSVSQLSTPDGEVEKLAFIPIDVFEAEVNNPQKLKKYVPYQPTGEYYRMIIDKIRKLVSVGDASRL